MPGNVEAPQPVCRPRKLSSLRTVLSPTFQTILEAMGAIPRQVMRPFLMEGGPLRPMRVWGHVPAEGEAWGSPSYQESSTKPSLAVNRYQRTYPKQAATPACLQGLRHHLLWLWLCCSSSWGRKEAESCGGPSVDHARECGRPTPTAKFLAKEAHLTHHCPLAYHPNHPRGNGCCSLSSYAPIPLGRCPSAANACLGAPPSGR